MIVEQDKLERFRTSAVLGRWLKEKWLDPRPLRQQAHSRSLVRWAIADDFFREEELDRLIEEHHRLAFLNDDVGLPYHSTAIRADKQPGLVGLDLMLNPIWHEYAAFVVGGSLFKPCHTVVKYRRHPPHARGFWIHTDRDPERPKALAILGYYDRDWTTTDGGLLQLWAMKDAVDVGQHIFRIAEYEGMRLDFLEHEREVDIEAAGEDGFRLIHAQLIDQIVPCYNRVVFLDFQTTPAFHSVSPSGSRARNGFLQWLY